MSELNVYDPDPTGTNPANKITAELQVVTSYFGNLGSLILADHGPFFDNDGLRVYVVDQTGTEVTLNKGTDYNLIMPYFRGMELIGQPIYGAINLLMETSPDVVYIDYQALGSEFKINRTSFLEDLANKIWNPRSIYWDTVINNPDCVPPEAHDQDAGLIFGAESLIAAVNGISDAILEKANLTARIALLEQAVFNTPST